MNGIEPNVEGRSGFSTLKELLLLLCLVLIGGFFGEKLTQYVAPGHGLLHMAGWAMLPFSLVIGLQFWLGLAILKEILGGSRRDPNQSFHWRRPKGAMILVPISTVLCGAVGWYAGSLSALNPILVLAIFLSVGLGYGLLLWRLSVKGHFDFWKWMGSISDTP